MEIETIAMKHARKVYQAELAKGERRSFRQWARRVYSSKDGFLVPIGKLAVVVGHA